MTTDTVYLLPGWQDYGADHWQSAWANEGIGVRVEQDDWHWPRRGDWMARLDEVLLDNATLSARPAVLVAHSLGCHLVASWAAHSRAVARVRGALLVAPPDLERDDMPPQVHSWRPLVRQRLPFDALVVASADDPYADLSCSRALAGHWGARFVDAGARGHLNEASGLGDWPAGRAWLRTLTAEA